MKQLKKIAAFFMAIAMTLGVCAQGAYAIGEDASGADATVSTQSVEVAASETALETISYVVVNSPAINAPDAEEILIGIGDENTTVDAAALTIRNQDTGETAEYDAEELTDGAALFRVDYTPKQAGTYELVSVRYTCGGVETETVLADLDIQAAFGVNTEADSEPDAVVVENTSEDSTESAATENSAPDVVVDVTSLNDGGDEDVAAAVEEALFDAAADADSDDGIAAFSMDGASTFSARSNKTYVVVLDPGHGTRKKASSPLDPGTSFSYNGRTYEEKDLTLKIAQYCKQELEQYANVKVYMTRTGDYNDVMSIKDRVELADRYRADILVSFHLNSAGEGATTAKGAEVYYPNANGANGAVSADAKQLSEQILNQLVAVGLTPHAGGLHIRNASEDKYEDGSAMDYLGINRYSKECGFPGVLVEHAYLNNKNEFYSFLSDDSKLKKLGVADATGIANYLGLTKNASAGHTTVYGDTDYSAVYDYNYYVEHNPDVYAEFGYSDEMVLWHFVVFGMAEGRQASANFDVNSYRYQYSDLRPFFRDDLKAYYLHYINSGIRERRVGTGTTKMQNPTTVFGGVDYAPVYDYQYYIDHNPDVVKVFGDDDWQVLWHFVIFGMDEGRQGSANFDVNSYRYQYSDLRPFFRGNLKSYYLHYINSGIRERRVGTGTTKMQNPTTVFGGVDYAPVYDYQYYIDHNPDVVKVFGDDDWQVLWHFVIFGMDEGRQGCADFNAAFYKANYTDLRDQYGSNTKSYYMHYIRTGKAAGLVGDRILNVIDGNHVIMCPQTTSSSQMVRLLKSKHVTFNQELYGMTMEQFCQLYVDECNAEGVDVSVAFCQAMLETGWLRYGGQVKASQFNFAGIKTADSSAFQTFSSVQEGIRAQVQHLKAYASKDALNNTCVDPRFKYVSRGTAPYVEWLCKANNPNGTGWTPDEGYSESILNFMNQLYKA